MNRITQWSYSRLKTYEQCPSKVKFRYIDKLSEPSSPQMDRGTRIHKLAEDFVTEKIDIIPDELMLFQTQFTMLKDAKFQARVAEAVARGIVQYKKDFEKTEGFTKI